MAECVCVDGRTRLIPLIGAVLVAVGVAAIYWPASLIVAGLLAMRLAGAAKAEQERQRREAVAAEERRVVLERTAVQRTAARSPSCGVPKPGMASQG